MMPGKDNYWAEHKRFYKLAVLAGFTDTIEALWNWIASGSGSTPTGGGNSYFPSGW